MDTTANIFLDTEFSDLKNPDLISLGLVSEHGCSLYLEIADFDLARCSQFVRATVLPLLSGIMVPQAEAAGRIRDYLRLFGSRVHLWTDAPNYDAWLLSELIAGIRQEIPEIRVCVPEFRGEVARRVYALAIEDAYRNGLRRHHGLDDAKALCAGWSAAKRVSPRQIREAIEAARKSANTARDEGLLNGES